jgi:flagellar motor protein MotB
VRWHLSFARAQGVEETWMALERNLRDDEEDVAMAAGRDC